MVNLEALYHVFALPKKYLYNIWISYYYKAPEIEDSSFVHNEDIIYLYGDIEEEMPPSMPGPWGNPVTISEFVNTKHSRNGAMRIYHKGNTIHAQNALIARY